MNKMRTLDKRTTGEKICSLVNIQVPGDFAVLQEQQEGQQSQTRVSTDESSLRRGQRSRLGPDHIELFRLLPRF